MKKFVIFCQAPADVQYALSLYDAYRSEGQFHFFVINVEGMYAFLAGLKLDNAHIVFIPYPDLRIKNPKSIIRTRHYIKYVIKRHFKNLKECDVYYFSNRYDWLVFAFIAYLAKRNLIYSYDHYEKSIPYRRRRICSAKQIVLELIYLYITCAIVHYEWVNDQAVISLNSDRYGVVERKISVSKETYNKYAYHIKTTQFQNNILFFESNNADSHIIIDYEQTLRHIINCLTEAGFAIYIKPHPRSGYSEFLKEFDLEILPEYIPGEFISYSKFSAIVGISTVAIAKIAQTADIPVYSLLDIFKFTESLQKETYRRYVIDQSNSKLSFIKDLGKWLEDA